MERVLHGDQAEQPMMRRLLGLPGYGRLICAFGLNELGWFIGTVALSVLVYRRTGSALGSAGFFLCSQALPGLIGPMVVGRLDRGSPRVLLPALYWAEAVLFGLLAWLTGRFALAPVLVVVVIDGVLALVARSLAIGARVQILKPLDLVREGGALQNVLFSVAYLVGPALGGAITAVGGTRAALLVSCGMFAVMGLALVARSIPRAIVHEGPETGRVRAALRYVRSTPPVARIILLQTVALVFFTIPMPIEVVYTVHTLHAGDAGYGVLLSVWGAGALLGSLAFTRWRRVRAAVLIAAGLISAAVGFGVIAVAPDLAVALVGAALAGVSNGLGSVAIATELQDTVPQSWSALVGSFSQGLAQISPGIGIAVGGLLTALASTRVTFGVAAGGCIVLAAFTASVLTTDATRRADAAAGDRGGGAPVDDAAPSSDVDEPTQSVA